jgi:hypothetical protein
MLRWESLLAAVDEEHEESPPELQEHVVSNALAPPEVAHEPTTPRAVQVHDTEIEYIQSRNRSLRLTSDSVSVCSHMRSLHQTYVPVVCLCGEWSLLNLCGAGGNSSKQTGTNNGCP